jgi:hypothetical protein
MGAPSSTTSRFRVFKRDSKTLDIKSDEYVFVDCSVLIHLLHIRHAELARTVFEIHAYSEDLDDVVYKYSAALINILRQVINIDCGIDLIELVFEGQSDSNNTSIIKRRVMRNKSLNKSIRGVYLGNGSAAGSLKGLAGSIGRPKSWFVHKVINTIATHNGSLTASYCHNESADSYIIKKARGMLQRKVTVVSVDTDYVALSPCNTIDRLIDPIRMRVMNKQEVLQSFGVTGIQLFLAYTLAGCDDLNTSIRGLGFAKSLKIAKARHWNMRDPVHFVMSA